ncbi:hypothetical protein GN156_28910, partial [bacterium LRH843]|nr:hypothetical protein [bacterium LRH843]
TQPDIDSNGGGDGDIDNTVTVSTDQLPDVSDSHEVSININAQLAVTKSGTLNDDDGNPGLSAGDTIDYIIDVGNAGTVTLTGIGIADNLV